MGIMNSSPVSGKQLFFLSCLLYHICMNITVHLPVFYLQTSTVFSWNFQSCFPCRPLNIFNSQVNLRRKSVPDAELKPTTLCLQIKCSTKLAYQADSPTSYAIPLSPFHSVTFSFNFQMNLLTVPSFSPQSLVPHRH